MTDEKILQELKEIKELLLKIGTMIEKTATPVFYGNLPNGPISMYRPYELITREVPFMQNKDNTEITVSYLSDPPTAESIKQQYQALVGELDGADARWGCVGQKLSGRKYRNGCIIQSGR
jgi:hypothetical protein